MVTITLVPVPPIGTKNGVGFAMRETGCTLETLDLPEYPPEARQTGRILWVHRVETCDLSLRKAAEASGLTAEQVGGLERGRYVFATETDRIAYVAALEGARRGALD